MYSRKFVSNKFSHVVRKIYNPCQFGLHCRWINIYPKSHLNTRFLHMSSAMINDNSGAVWMSIRSDLRAKSVSFSPCIPCVTYNFLYSPFPNTVNALSICIRKTIQHVIKRFAWRLSSWPDVDCWWW